MFRKLIRRTFCVNNKDPIHVRNAQNDHYRKLFEQFAERDETQIRANTQESFNDSVYLDKCEVILYQFRSKHASWKSFMRLSLSTGWTSSNSNMIWESNWNWTRWTSQCFSPVSNTSSQLSSKIECSSQWETLRRSWHFCAETPKYSEISLSFNYFLLLLNK